MASGAPIHTGINLRAHKSSHIYTTSHYLCFYDSYLAKLSLLDLEAPRKGFSVIKLSSNHSLDTRQISNGVVMLLVRGEIDEAVFWFVDRGIGVRCIWPGRVLEGMWCNRDALVVTYLDKRAHHVTSLLPLPPHQQQQQEQQQQCNTVRQLEVRNDTLPLVTPRVLFQSKKAFVTAVHPARGGHAHSPLFSMERTVPSVESAYKGGKLFPPPTPSPSRVFDASPWQIPIGKHQVG